jgi:hypothetical protein
VSTCDLGTAAHKIMSSTYHFQKRIGKNCLYYCTCFIYHLLLANGTMSLSTCIIILLYLHGSSQPRIIIQIAQGPVHMYQVVMMTAILLKNCTKSCIMKIQSLHSQI